MTRIAIPLEPLTGLVDPHFGHASAFEILTGADGRISDRQRLSPPPHEPGTLPRWLIAQGVQVVIAGGMGGKARELLEAADVVVILGAGNGRPEALALHYLAGQLHSLGSDCTVHEGHGCGGH